ncbi:GAF and ANTAR domain-containing protein [Streptomyces sp. NPDC001137]|uniref:GAF and ANTAR domain-containing protein n=1 Tax=Streptomyces sp. NPDC001137 TaxID=3154378 RepID=UPI0033231259
MDAVRAIDVIAEVVRDARPGETPARLCAVAEKLLPIVGASVSLRSSGMPIRLAASNSLASYLAGVQTTLGDGPWLHAYRTGAPVLACDLAGGRDMRRWPLFARQATAVGVRAVYSMPLGSDDGLTVGTLDLYRDGPGDLTEDELRRAQLLAAVMTLALTTLPREESGGGEEAWLGGLAAEHDEVYQAIGMVMAQLGVAADEASARLRARAFAQGRAVLEVAHDVISHRERLDGD